MLGTGGGYDNRNGGGFLFSINNTVENPNVSKSNLSPIFSMLDLFSVCSLVT